MLKYIFKKATNLPSVDVQSDKCIRYRNKKNVCSSCADVCPVNAIYERNGKLEIEESKCNKCGICYGVCHSKAIEIKNFIDFSFKDKNLNKDKYFVSCSEKKYSGVDLSVSCLNIFRPEDIVMICLSALESELVFLVPECEECSKSFENCMFESSFAKAKAFLSECCIDSSPKIISSEKELNECKESLDGKISRSDFIKFSRKQLDFLFKDALKETLSIKEEITSETIRESVLKAVIHNSYNKKNELTSDNGFFLSLVSNDKCENCGVCQSICVWKAWNIKEDKPVHSLKNCRACGLCKETCPSGAIVKKSFTVESLSGLSD